VRPIDERPTARRWEPLTLPEVEELMASFEARWWFAGGHAPERHLGRSWRGHDDVDIGICPGDVHT